MVQNKKTTELIKIMELVKDWDPQTWWREYPPKILYKDRKISARIVKTHLKDIFNDKTQKIGVYFHIPFCKSRCGFCKFNSEISHSGTIDNYLSLIDKELKLYGVNFKESLLDNLYIGGGTPSLLSEKQISSLFKIAHHHFKIKSSTNILTEGTPDTSTLAKLKLFKELGVNRYTIGVQCFDDRVLKLSGRLHNVKDIYKAFSNVRRAGIRYINLDILLGLYGETKKTYSATLQGILDLKPDCVSFMLFDYGRGVSSNYAVKANNSYFCKKSLRRNIFSYLGSVMEKAGYIIAEGFSDSTFVLRGQEDSINRNLYNRNSLHSVLGVGRSAESSFGRLKYFVESSDKEYKNKLNAGKLRDFNGVNLSEDEYIRRYFIYNYILFGKINKNEFVKKFGFPVDVIVKKKFTKLIKNNYFFDTGDSLIFANDINQICNPRKLQSANYGNKEYKFLRSVKYFYSPKVVSELKKLIF